ncbi:hypothetical protein [Lysobacter arvi]|uniref:Lipoprotein n=1 Tax=Lysobacter arvi TaxID=3038776 RepID=A0ABU1CHF4_9GAMM|nr:hypothetical protein [Lysobacter arvi]MDR0184374.1 hypothetical protein [Lysobacter arvi]
MRITALALIPLLLAGCAGMEYYDNLASVAAQGDCASFTDGPQTLRYRDPARRTESATAVMPTRCEPKVDAVRAGARPMDLSGAQPRTR